MNTKKLILTILPLASLLVLVGCEDGFLDQVRYTSEVEETQYYNTVEECNSSTKVAYRYINYSAWWETMNWRFLSGEASSDNAWAGNTAGPNPEYSSVSHYQIDAGNVRNEAHWIMLYKSIGRFNSIIEGIESAPIDEASKNQFLSELKFLRAWCYFDLVRNWGGVPLVLEIYPPDVHLPRSAAEEVYAQITGDLRESASVLPEKSDYPPADRFRASRGAALTLLAKVSLYTENWAEAERSAKEVIDGGEYDLEPFFGDLWDYHYKNGQESVFEIQSASSVNPDLPFNQFQIMVNSPADGGWGWYSLTSDLENAFISEGDSIRLQWTMNRHGLPVAGDPDKPVFDGRPYHGALTNPVPASKSGRYSRKHYIPVAQRPSNGRAAMNDIILRFADVLLIHAEACAVQNKTGEALASLQRVRERADLPAVTGLEGGELIEAIHKERRLELAFEGDRLYDLRRWKDPDGNPVINSILGPGGSFVRYNTETSTDYFETNNPLEPQDKGIHFNPDVHLLWPIPTSQIIASEGAVEQNPGYF